MVVDDLQDCLGGQQTQIVILLVLVNDLEHPENGARVDDLLLVRCLVLDVEVYHVQELVQDSPVFRVQQRLENVHEEFLIELVKFHLTLV